MARDFPNNASSEKIDVGTWDFPSSVNTATICAAVNFDDLSNDTDHRFIAKASGTAENQHLWMLGRLDSPSPHNNQLRARLKIGGTVGTYVSSNNIFTAGQWHNVAVRYDGSNVDLFADGSEVSSAAYAVTGDISSGDTNDIWIANAPGAGGNSHSLNGRLAQILVIARALSDDELKAIANGVPVTRFCEGPTVTQLCMPLGISSPEVDYSGNDRSGTITGSVTIGDHVPTAPFFGFDTPAIVVAGAGGATLVADSGSYAWTGTAATLLHNKVVSAASGSYAWTGQAATLAKTSLISAESGSYAWTGQAATLLYNRLISAESGSYAWTGQDATLTKISGATLVADAGSYAWTGTAASLLYNRILSAEPGSYTWAGQSAGLTYSAASIWTATTPVSTTWTATPDRSSTWTPTTKKSTTWTEN